MNSVTNDTPAAPGFDLTDEQLERLRTASMKPEEISGASDVQHARVRELLSWFARFTAGRANPKWLVGHAMELAYYLATEGADRGIDIEAIKKAAYLEGVNISAQERSTLERIGVIAAAAPALEAPAAPAKHSPGAVHIAVSALEQERARGYRQGLAAATRTAPLAEAPQAPAAPVTPAAAMAALKAVFASDPEYAWSWHCGAWACAHDEGLDTGAANRAAARLMHMAFGCDTSKHPNFVDAHRKAAPAADASDTALLDAMERRRIAVAPEFDGPWDAELYGEGEEPLHVGSGATPREALRAALAAQAKEDGGAA